LDVQVGLQLLQIANKVSHVLVDSVDELDVLAPVLAVVDE